MYRGTRLSMARTVTFAMVYIALGVVFCGTSFYEGVSVFLAPVYALLAAAAAVGSYIFADRRITFWRDSAYEPEPVDVNTSPFRA